MSDEIDAVAAVGTTGLLASVIEGRETGTSGSPGECANCGAETSLQFCPACGQATHLHRSLGHMLEEMVHGVLHFDSKAWRTFPMLALRPGTLTREYIHGKRARYISPVAMFLFSVLALFIAFAFSGSNQADEVSDTPIGEFNVGTYSVDQPQGSTELPVLPILPAGPLDREELSTLIDALDIRMGELELASRDEDVASLLMFRSVLEGARSGEYQMQSDGRGNYGIEGIVGLPDFVSRAIEASDDQDVLSGVSLGSEWLPKKVKHKLENPELLLYKFQNNAYKFSFLLIPLSIPFVALLFPFKRGATLYDHAVFAIYSISSVSLAFLVISLLGRLQLGIASFLATALILAIPVHMFFQLKGTYALPWSTAVLRLPFLLVFALVALVVWVLLIIAFGFL